MQRLTALKEQTKAKTKSFLHIDSKDEQLQQEHISVVTEIENNAVFNPLDTLNDEPPTAKERMVELPGKVQQLSHNILHPVTAAKAKASEQLGVSEQPYLLDDANKNLLVAHKELEIAQARQATDETHTSEDVDGWSAEIDAIEDYHEKRRVAWSTGRFTHRARVIQSGQRAFPVLPSNRGNWKSQGHQWTQWLSESLLFIRQEWSVARSGDEIDEDAVWDQDLFMELLERIIMASDPAQRFFLRLHQLWRWENKSETATWFAVWMIMWYCKCVLIFAYCYAVYNVFQHGRQTKRQALLQKSYNRTANSDSSDLTFGEMIERHGQSNWIDPMLEAVGPSIQFRTHQLADLLEILTNFYDWKNPQATSIALVVFGFVVVAPTIAGTAFAMRLLALVMILTFFTDHPASIRFPRFRNMMSPIIWIFGMIPTQSATSFEYLRVEADELRETVSAKQLRSQDKSSYSGADNDNSKQAFNLPTNQIESQNVDLFANRCKWHNMTGRLVVSLTSIRFVHSFPRREIWEHQYRDLVEIRKSAGQESQPNKVQTSLELIFNDGSEGVIEDLTNRDEMFNIIIAFSGLRWKQLQPIRAPPAKGIINVMKEKIQQKIGVDV